jgi:competence protein ComEC
MNNAGSIVVRVVYKGWAILLTGDTDGRSDGATANSVISAEKQMLARKYVVPIKAIVLVAGHHGANNANSTPFIREVDPQYVIFSAGHKYSHPRKTTAQRFMDAGIQRDNMFRTDRGDDEGTKEWSCGRETVATDAAGDDDVDVTISTTDVLKMKYR